MQPIYKACLFDFDFTLADSSEGVVDCINTALTRLGLPIKPSAEICRTIGYSLRETREILCGPQEPLTIEKFKEYFVERADQVMAAKTKLFPDVPGVLADLKEHSIKIGIVTSKFRYRIEEIMKREKLSDYIDTIIGCEDVNQQKPNPEGVFLAGKRMQVKTEDMILIGDSIVDAKTAMNAGVPFIGVLSGVMTRDELAVYPHLKIISAIGELIDT
jgi:phosphoglycolate phosphatase